MTGQTPVVVIEGLEIQGNKKTRRIAIESYLNFEIGDSLLLKDLMPLLKENEKLLLNSRLFNEAQLNVGQWKEDKVVLRLKVQEAWYIFPIPVFELADRNFNVWWKSYGFDARRVNFGLWTYWRNPFGYNDRIKIIAQWGFTRKFELEYQIPPLTQKKPWGFGANILYSDNREFAFDIDSNRLAFFRDLESPMRQYKRFRSSVHLRYRQSLFNSHRAELYFRNLEISDSLVLRNPDFFLDSAKQQRSFAFEYEFKRDKRDLRAYPQKGHYLRFLFLKRGFGIFKDINQLWLISDLEYYKQWNSRWSNAIRLKGRYSVIRKKQPFAQQEALGYGEDYVRGYQYYVINGQDYVLIKTDINFKIVDWEIPLFKNKSSNYIKSIPFRLHMRYHFDYGFVRDRHYQYADGLANQTLLSTGVGLDFALYYYNILTQIEYSLNKLGEKDVYLRFKFDF